MILLIGMVHPLFLHALLEFRAIRYGFAPFMVQILMGKGHICRLYPRSLISMSTTMPINDYTLCITLALRTRLGLFILRKRQKPIEPVAATCAFISIVRHLPSCRAPAQRRWYLFEHLLVCIIIHAPDLINNLKRGLINKASLL